MYKPSSHIATFYLAGFQHWDGAFALGSMKVGDILEMRPEPDNPFDPNAVAVYAGDMKLGYVPRDENELLAVMAAYGHLPIFQLRVLQVDAEADPWRQVRVALHVLEAEKGAN